MANLKHGHHVNKKASPEYKSWQCMKRRCLVETSHNFKDYGGRGITVCERWKNSFVNFLNDMGLKPYINYSLERVDNNRNYNPANCKWASKSEQSKNRRARKTATIYKGETSTQASKRLGGGRSMVKQRLNNGWPKSEAFSIPKGGYCG